MLRLAAALTFVLAAASTAWWSPVPRFLITAVGVLLLVAAALVGLRATWTGLIARGTAWAAVSLGMIVVHLNAADRCEVARHALGASVVTVLAACAGLALAGPAGQRDPSSRFAPARLGGVLQLALVLAVADAVMLGLFAVAARHDGEPSVSTFLAVTTLATVAGAVGLYRLASWGYLLLAAVNAVIAAVMIVDPLDLGDSPLRLMLLVPAMAQLLVAAPVGVAIARGAPVVPPAWLARPLRHARITALVAMAALAVQPLFAPSLLEWCYRVVLAR